jgi:hypothetical protein
LGCGFAALGIECYNEVFPNSIRQILAQVPEEWLRTCDCLRFNANGWQVTLCVGRQMPTPANAYCSLLGNVTGELAERVQQFGQDKERFREDERKAISEMESFLCGFRSFKQLRDNWPEGKPFYQNYDVDRTEANVPAHRVKSINEMLGIAA